MTSHIQNRSIRVALRRIGGRTLAAMAIALVSAVLLFASPEIGLGGAIGGVVAGGISAVLMRHHA